MVARERGGHWVPQIPASWVHLPSLVNPLPSGWGGLKIKIFAKPRPFLGDNAPLLATRGKETFPLP